MTGLRLLVVACLGLSVGVVAAGGCLGPTEEGVACSAGEQECDGECFVLSHDPRHCGACGVVCYDGRVCQDGVCRDRCWGGEVDCGGGCTALTDDDDHCGACGTACGPLDHCAGGTCVSGCDAGELVCSGACTDVELDVDNCGGCGNACEWPLQCNGGLCTSGGSDSGRRSDHYSGHSDYSRYEGGGPSTF
jgi:hypothetical protein